MSETIRETDTSDVPTLRDRALQAAKLLASDSPTLVGLTIISLTVLVAVFAPEIAPYEPTRQFSAPAEMYNPLPPLAHSQSGHQFLLGTDPVGRDLLSRMIFGTRPMLVIVLGTVGLSAALGIPAGVIAAYYGGIVDEIIMRLMDVLISFPAVVMAIMLLGVVGTEGITIFGFRFSHIVTLIIAVGIIWAPRFARIMRGAALTEMNEDYVESVKVSGASDLHIMFNEIGINVTGPLIVQATLSMSIAVLVSAALSFIGVGVQPPTASWGRMLAESRDYLISGEWWITLTPGLAILIVSLSFNIVGDRINDVIDPEYQSDQSQLER